MKMNETKNKHECEICTALLPRGRKRFCSRACYQIWWKENLQRRVSKKGNRVLKELRERGQDPAHGGTVAKRRGEKIALSNRLYPRRKAKNETRWKPIPGFEGLYSASVEGKIRSEDRIVKTKTGQREYKGKVLTPIMSNNSYNVILKRSGESYNKRIPALIAETFFGTKPEGYVLVYRDGDSSNVALSNLRYAPKGEKINLRKQEATRKREESRRKKDVIRELLKQEELNMREIAEIVGCSVAMVSRVNSGER